MAFGPDLVRGNGASTSHRTSRGMSRARRGRSRAPSARSTSRFARRTEKGEGNRPTELRSEATTRVPPSFDSHQLPPRGGRQGTLRHQNGVAPQSRDAQESRLPPSERVQQERMQGMARTWASVARTALKGYELDYHTPVQHENKLVAYFPDEALEAADPVWEECLVGYFIGKKLPFKLVETAMKHAWGPKLLEVRADDRGFYFFRIPDAEYRRKLLDGGPITVTKVPLILQQWDPCLELKKRDHSTVPVWIRLRNIPLVLWSARGIGGIASLIGKPLHVDLNTETMKFLAYARVCVELKATDERQETVTVLYKGITREVDVEYEWRPIACPRCGVFGHKCSDMSHGQDQSHGQRNVTRDRPVQGPSARLNTDQIPAALKAKSPLQKEGQAATDETVKSGLISTPEAADVQPDVPPVVGRRTRSRERRGKALSSSPVDSVSGSRRQSKHPGKINARSASAAPEIVPPSYSSADDLEDADDLGESEMGSSFDSERSGQENSNAETPDFPDTGAGTISAGLTSIVPDSQPTPQADPDQGVAHPQEHPTPQLTARRRTGRRR